MREVMQWPSDKGDLHPLSRQNNDAKKSEEASVKSLYARFILWRRDKTYFLNISQVEVSAILPLLMKHML